MAKLESILSMAFLSSLLTGLLIAVSACVVTPSQVAQFKKPVTLSAKAWTR